MALIFLSAASKTAVNGDSLTSAFLEDVAVLHDRFPEHAFVCPLIQGYAILPYLQDKVATWQVWGKYCETILSPCDEVWVMLGRGWKNPSIYSDPTYNTSDGVAAEIKLAIEKQKKIVFYDPETFHVS